MAGGTVNPGRIGAKRRDASVNGHEARTLRGPLFRGRRRHGRGVPCPRHAARSGGRGQDPPRRREADEARRRRFVQEARTASALNHPNIATIHDIDPAEGVTSSSWSTCRQALSALVPRRDARRRGDSGGDPHRRRARRAHAAGIVHRDLKPANVVVGRRRHGQGPGLRAGQAVGARRAEGRGRDVHRSPTARRPSVPRWRSAARPATCLRSRPRRQGGRTERHLQLRGSSLRDGDGPTAPSGKLGAETLRKVMWDQPRPPT